jgi:hypothetical protein
MSHQYPALFLIYGGGLIMLSRLASNSCYQMIRRITVQSQSRQIVCKILSRKTLHKNRAGGVSQGEGPKFKPQYWKQKKKSFRYGWRHDSSSRTPTSQVQSPEFKPQYLEKYKLVLLGRLRLGVSWFEASLGKQFMRAHLQKWTGGMAHVVECLFCKREALSSNPSPI